MKKITLLLILCLPLKALTQMQGIGPFKINKATISLIDSISKQTAVPVKMMLDDRPTVIRLTENHNYLTDKIMEMQRDYDLCCGAPNPDFNIRVFYINCYRVSDIGIEDIYLTFFKDTLIQFKCKASKQFLEALNIKYGKPLEKLLTKTIACQNGYGATTYNDEYRTYYTWNTKLKNISAKAEVYSFYGNDCKPATVENFVLKDILKRSKIDKIQEKLEAEERKSELEDESKKLKDF